MQGDASNFTSRPNIFDRTMTLDIGMHTAHGVVCHRADGNRLLNRIQPLVGRLRFAATRTYRLRPPAKADLENRNCALPDKSTHNPRHASPTSTFMAPNARMVSPQS